MGKYNRWKSKVIPNSPKSEIFELPEQEEEAGK